MIVSGERVFAPFKSCPGGGGGGLVLDETDSHIMYIHMYRAVTYDVIKTISKGI